MTTVARPCLKLGLAGYGGRLPHVLHRILGGALVVLFVMTAVTALATHAAPLAGFEAFAIRGRSMEPAIPLGSIVGVTRTNAPAVGDVISHRTSNGTVVTHRVVGLVAVDGVEHFLTQGDANERPDAAPIGPGTVIGRVEWSVPLVGYLAWMLSTPSGLIGVVSAFMAVLLLMWWVEEIETLRRERARLLLGKI